MKSGDIICLPENTPIAGYNFARLTNVNEEDFPLYAICKYASNTSVRLHVYNSTKQRWFLWDYLQRFEGEYCYVLEAYEDVAF